MTPPDRKFPEPNWYPKPKGALGDDDIATRVQRRERRDWLGYLRSDLHERSPEKERAGTILMASPLGWRVEIGSLHGGDWLWAAIYKPDGERWAFASPASFGWLEGELP